MDAATNPSAPAGDAGDAPAVDALAGGLLCVLRPDGSLQFANRALCDLLGYDPHALPAGRLVHGEDVELLGGARPGQVLPVRFWHAAGHWLRLSLGATPLPAPRGGDSFVLAASPDLERGAGARFREVAEAAPLGIYVLDRGCFVYANGAFAAMVGRPAAALLGQRAIDLVLPADRRQLKRHAGRVIAGDRWLQYSYRVRRPDGSVRELSECLAVVHGGGRRAIIGCCLDTTDRSRADESLRSGDEFLRALDASTPDILALTGPAGRSLFANASHQEVLGYRPLEILGVHAKSLLHPEDQAKVQRAMAAWYRDREPIELEIRVRHRQGHWVWLASHIEVIQYADGHHAGTVVLSRDITARRKAERELQRLAAELRAPQEALAAFAYTVAAGQPDALRAVAKFASQIAGGYAASRGDDPEGFIRGLVSCATQMQALINDLLAARLGSEGEPAARLAA